MSTKERRFQGEYASDGPQRRLAIREAAGHRCIRCGHPFRSGEHGKGEWSPCDERCVHGGPVRIAERVNGDRIEFVEHEQFPSPACRIVLQGTSIEAQWRVLTVHHLDGDKANDAWWNTLALCQRCHLQIQTRVDPHIPYFLSHSEWFKPYVAGFYAHKYEGRMITRKEAESRLVELLAYENKA